MNPPATISDRLLASESTSNKSVCATVHGGMLNHSSFVQMEIDPI